MQTEWNFNYTGEEQSITLPPGKYRIQCYGASGGYTSRADFPTTYKPKGGYSAGEITLKKDTLLYVYVGRSGESVESQSRLFNGGGCGGYSCGGGATDIRLVGGSWDNEQGLFSRIIVAGGAGANAAYNKSEKDGAGGGLKGGNGGGSGGEYTPGATQYDGGRGSSSEYDGLFGLGGGSNSNCFFGGGGGWYGGAGGRSSAYISASGGSGYILTKNSYKPKGYTPTSEYYFENTAMSIGGNTSMSNGHAKITLLQALPFLNISSYNSTTATFKADHTDPTLLTKIEIFIDDILKETITTDLTTEKTINYTLEDNALHTLKIVVTDSNNATAEKVLSISKNIMPLPENVNLQDISTKLVEVNAGFKVGKTSIINTLALKNIEANLNNTLVELSEKIKTSFDSSDASVQDLQNQVTQKNNTITQLETELSKRKRFITGTYTFTKTDAENFNLSIYDKEGTSKTLTIPVNMGFSPSLIVLSGVTFSTTSKSYVYFDNVCNSNFYNFGYNSDSTHSNPKAVGILNVSNVGYSSLVLTLYKLSMSEAVGIWAKEGATLTYKIYI
ncbi:glycine-rich protein [Clostridioides difficile]|nr:glycine-rich protein [Clostridioides difficile]